MFNAPKNWNEAISVGEKLMWAASRLHLVGIALGVIGTIAIQLLTGFWDFRNGHQEIVRVQYQETLQAHAAFQRQIERFNAVFEGNPVSEHDVHVIEDTDASTTVRQIQQARSFDIAAQAYIREINEITRLLPSAQDEVSDYIDAIAALNRYYAASESPTIRSVDWVIFYGKFRADLDEYFKTRDAYLEELAGEVGSYWRAVRNS